MVYLVEIEMTTQWIDQWTNELNRGKIQSVKSHLETFTINLETLTIKLSFACMFPVSNDCFEMHCVSNLSLFPNYACCFESHLKESNVFILFPIDYVCFQSRLFEYLFPNYHIERSNLFCAIPRLTWKDNDPFWTTY